MKLASLLTLTIAGLVAADFPAPTNVAYVDWLLTGDAALAGASQECKQSLQSYKSILTCWNGQAEAQVRSCFCATDSDGLTRAVSNYCAGGGLFPWMQATLTLRAQCEAVPPPPVVIETVVEPVKPAPEPTSEIQPQPTTNREQPPVVSDVSSTQDEPGLSSSASTSSTAPVSTSKKLETSVAGTSSATVKATTAASTSSAGSALPLPAFAIIVSVCLSLVL
ncbi:hypothetical protein HDU81_001745 [Chytriomyces hyalinus]|nr:hypothetical protein HDU81_001745 [Chytriomyces hyalinus]